MNTKKLRGRFVCLFLMVAMALAMLPSLTFAQNEKTLYVSYSSGNYQYEAGGRYIIDGESTSFTHDNTWYEIIPNDKDVVFELTQPNDSYPVPLEDRTLFVTSNGMDISSRVSNDSFTITSADLSNDDVFVNIYWSRQEKDFNVFGTEDEGLFPLWVYCNGLSCNVIETNSSCGFGPEIKMFVTPENDIVTVTLDDSPTTLMFDAGDDHYDLLETPVVQSGNDTMIEYSPADNRITFFTGVGILKDEYITGEYGEMKRGMASLTIQKNEPGPGPGPGPQGPQAQLRHPINDICGFLALDQNDPDNKSYVKYDIPLQYVYFSGIPVDQEGNTIDGYYDDLVKEGFTIEYTWPEQQDYDHRLKADDNVECEFTLTKAGMNPITLHTGNSVKYEGDMVVTKFEVAEPIVVSENYDGVAVTDDNGKYFKYNYQDKVKFNIEFTCSYENPDHTKTTETCSYNNVTIDEAMQKKWTGQRIFLMADTQETTHWEAGGTYDAYFALAEVIAKGEVQVEASDTPITYWEDQAADAVAEIAPENTLSVKSIVPKNDEQADVIFEQTVSKPNDEKYKDQKLTFVVVPNDNDYSKGTINVYRTYDSTLPGIFKPDFITSFENTDISYVFDQAIADEVEGYKQDFKTFDYDQKNPLLHYYDNVYLITDLDMVNVEVNGGNAAIRDAGNLINFSSEFLNDVKHSNLETQLYVTGNQHWEGRGTAMHYGCGQLLLIYDDTVYAIVDNVGYLLINVIYIPDDTPKTEEDFRAAALKRIKELLNGSDDDYEIGPDDHWASPGGAAGGNAGGDIESQRMHQLFLSALSMAPGETDISAHTVDVCYRFGVKSIGRMALWIVADSSKMMEQSEALMKSVDMKTKASVSTTDANLPLDAKISVTEHTDDDIYEDQMTRIGLEEGVVFDIDLNSVMRDGKVQTTEVENGFEVRIPVPDSYADKTVYAYYTPDSGDLEVHEATVVKGDSNQYFAVFYTDHFSTYTIGEEPKVLKEISIKSNPSKVEYLEGKDAFDVTGGKITLKYESGKTEDIDMTKDMVSGFDNTKVGKQTLTVTYEGKTATFDVTIKAKSLAGISIKSNPSKVEYLEGKDTLDVTGGKITLTYDNGTTEDIDLTKDMVSGFDNTKVRKQTLTVTYEGKTATFDVTVKAKSLSEISIKSNPTKLEYVEGTDLDVTGGKITLTYDNGTTEEVDLTKEMISGFDNTKVGKQTLTVTYEGKTATFDVTIKAKSVSEISIKSKPDKLEYIEGSKLKVTGGKITLTYDNGTTEDIDMTKEMISGFDNTKVGKQTLTVTYEGKTATFDVTVTEKGKIEEDTEQQEKNAGQASIEVDDDAIDLTEEEEEAMDDGLDIIVSLEVTDITDTVPEEDKKLVEEALQEDMEVAIFLDMSLFKFIEGSTDKTQITETKKPITITFTIPEKYRKEGRTYSIIRVHDGKTDIIKVTPDKNWVVRFTSDKFSTYALAFVDKEEAVKTGDRANALLWIILMGGAACIAAGAAVIFRRRKTTKR